MNLSLMKILKQIVVAAVLMLGSIPAFAQQDPMYSQYMFNPLSINPAYAGSRGVLNGALSFRQQWVGFDGAPSTQVVAINSPTRKGKVGLGLEVIADQLGPKKSTAGYLTYAYRMRLGKGKLAFGLGGGLVNYRINWNLIEYKDQTDAFAALNATTRTVPDFKFGVYFNTKKFYVGASATHLNQATYAVAIDSINMNMPATMKMHQFVTAGYAMKINDDLLFSPSVMIRNVIGASTASIDLNLNVKFRDVMWFGVSARSDKAVVAMAMVNLTQKFKLGYSFDVNLNRLRGYQSGTHEIMLGFDLNVFHSDVVNPRYF